MIELLRSIKRRFKRPSIALREDFVRLFPKDSVGAEIGVFRGQFTKHLLTHADPKELHLFDLWSSWGEYYPDWGEYTNFGKLTTKEAYENVLTILKEHDRRHVSKIHEGDAIPILKTFPDHYFDWVYLDSAHSYEQTKVELEILQHKMKLDGMIAGHDWVEDPNHIHHGVMVAVQEFCRETPWKVHRLDYLTQWCLTIPRSSRIVRSLVGSAKG